MNKRYYNTQLFSPSFEKDKKYIEKFEIKNENNENQTPKSHHFLNNKSASIKYFP